MSDGTDGGGEAFDGTPLEPTEGTQQPAQQGQQGQDDVPESLRQVLPPEAIAHLSRSRKPGEPWDAAAAREWQQQRARAHKAEGREQRIEQKLQGIEQSLMPILQREYQQVQRALERVGFRHT